MAKDSKNKPSKGLVGEIEQSSSSSEQFLEKNYKLLILLILLLVVGGISYVVIREAREEKQAEAAAQFMKSQNKEELQELIEAHAGTNAAGSAKILLASKLWKDGEDQKALDLLEELKTSKLTPQRVQATFAQAQFLLKQGDAKEAKSLLQELVNDKEAQFLAPFALLTLGDQARKQGDNDAATSYYESIKDNFPNIEQELLKLVEERLSLVGLAPPTFVAPPAPKVEVKEEKEEKKEVPPPSNTEKNNDDTTSPSAEEPTATEETE